MPRSPFEQRDRAFSLTLPAGGGRIIELITIRNRLYAFREKDVYEVVTADLVDPERQHHETKHSYRQVFRYGCSHPVVACVFIQTKRLLDAVLLEDQSISRQAIVENAFHSMQELVRCFEICQSLADETLAAAQQCDILITAQKKDDNHLEIIQVECLEEKVKDFLISAKRFLIRQGSVLELLLGKSDHGARFNTIVKWAEQRFGEADPLTKMLRDDLGWLSFLSEARNATEHPKQNYYVEINNLTLMPGNRFTSPAWRFHIGQFSQDQFTDLIVDMSTYVENMISLAEDLILLCLEKSHVKWFRYEFYRLSDEHRNPSCPVAYDVTMRRQENLEAQNGQEVGKGEQQEK